MSQILLEGSTDDEHFLHSVRNTLDKLRPTDIITPVMRDNSIIRSIDIQEYNFLIFLLGDDSSKKNYRSVLSDLNYTREQIADLDPGEKPVIITVLPLNTLLPSDIFGTAVVYDPGTGFDEIALGISDKLDIVIKKQKEAEQREKKRIESLKASLAEYINPAIKFLEEREKQFKRTASIWYAAGFLMLIIGVVSAIWFSVAIANDFKGSSNWPYFAFVTLRGVVVIGLLVATSKYSFELGKSFMNEGLRNSDRIHAIGFGKFYVSGYGDKATWDELKEAFQNWNIDHTSSFAKLDSGSYDPKLFEAIIGLVRAIRTSDQKDEKSKKPEEKHVKEAKKLSGHLNQKSLDAMLHTMHSGKASEDDAE